MWLSVPKRLPWRLRRYQDTHNTKEYAPFYKVGRRYTKYRSSGVFQRLPERGGCYEFIIETGNINISSYKTLYMYSKKYHSPTSCHRHGRNEIKQERLVTWSQEAPSPFSYQATESIGKFTQQTSVGCIKGQSLRLRYNNFD